MMKKWLIVILFGICGANYAGECKYCGCETKDVYVFRCKECRKFFCDNCRDGDGKKDTGNPFTSQLEQLNASLKAIGDGLTVICPECGAKDRMIYGRMQDGKIRIIKEASSKK